MRFVVKLILGISVVMVIVAATVCFINHFSLRSDITDIKARAQVSADADEIYDRLVKLDQKMEERGMTDGYTSLFVQSPWTSVKEIRANIKTLIDRAELISQLDRSSDAYQQGLDDIRGTLGELDLQAWGWWALNEGGWIWAWLILPLFIVGIVASGIWLLLTSSNW